MPLTPPAGLPPILHRDQHMVVLDKPSGLLSVPGIGPENADSLAGRVQDNFPGALIVHRLDRDTSGVIIMALDPQSHRELSRQFQDRKVGKRYVAIVAGFVKESEGLINLPLRKDMDRPPRHIVDHAHGKRAVTEWRILQRETEQTRIELQPQTGRSHQLRVHMKSINHPILGDDLYAPPEVLEMSDRLMLHALSLAIAHPVTGAPMTFTADCPF